MNRLLILTALAFVMQAANAQTDRITGFYDKNLKNETSLELSFDANLNKDNIGLMIKRLSLKPHHIGSPGDKENAEYIRMMLDQWGWDAKIETFYVLFPTPRERELEMVSPSSYKALLKEKSYSEDPSTGQSGQLPSYNAYSADGDVTSELVFVNYGLPGDYAVLDKMGIDVKGKIVIVKYGRSWRGIKPKIAQEHGAVGCIIYSDPADDGYFYGDVFPKGPFRNEFGVQRGSVMDMPIYPGDPLTPGIGAEKDAKRLNRSEALNLLKIPVLPISYHDAAPLLQALDGAVAPVEWHGGLPFAYHTGPGKVRVHLKLAFNWDIIPCYDVIAKIKGSVFPDEWVIRGNHQDAWVNGASDPVSGLAAMLEEAKSIGSLVKTGWKPARTIVYCAWDGEEPALLGSTEWVEEHEKELIEKAIIYINSDGNGRGFLSVEGSHALEPFIDEIAKDVKDPETHISVFERKKDHDVISVSDGSEKKKLWEEKELKLGALGSGSDYSSFIQHAGIPALNMGYGGEDLSGEYHSIYDTYWLYENFKDPEFQYGVALAETAGRAVLRMAEADGLPFDFTHLYNTISSYSQELIDLVNTMRDNTDLENRIIISGGYSAGYDPVKHFVVPQQKEEVPFLDFTPLQNALHELGKWSDSLKIIYDRNILSGKMSKEFNEALYHSEHQLMNETGLPRREWYKHTIYAPGMYTGYGVKTMPGIREAIENRDWSEARQQIVTDATVIKKLADYFKQMCVNFY